MRGYAGHRCRPSRLTELHVSKFQTPWTSRPPNFVLCRKRLQTNVSDYVVEYQLAPTQALSEALYAVTKLRGIWHALKFDSRVDHKIDADLLFRMKYGRGIGAARNASAVSNTIETFRP